MTLSTLLSFVATASGLRYLGNGVAYKIDCPPLVQVRRQLAGQWKGWLEAQDRQAFSPHVTIQNKADSSAARELYESLTTTSFDEIRVPVTGLSLWRYENGPWSLVNHYHFKKEQTG